MRPICAPHAPRRPSSAMAELQLTCGSSRGSRSSSGTSAAKRRISATFSRLLSARCSSAESTTGSSRSTSPSRSRQTIFV